MSAGGGSNVNNLLIIGLVLVGALLAGGYWVITKRKLADVQDQVTQRKADADRLEQIIKDVENYQKQKDSLQQRIDLINQLKQNQKGPVRIMDQVSRDLPDLVWIDRMNVDNGRIAISGRSLNPNAVANFTENIKNDPYFEEPQVGSISQVSASPLVYGFDMDFAFSYIPKAAAGGTTTATTTSGTAAGTATGTTGTAPSTATSATGGKK
jgi:Tfp pilus assembly protein PilN